MNGPEMRGTAVEAGALLRASCLHRVDCTSQAVERGLVTVAELQLHLLRQMAAQRVDCGAESDGDVK